MLTPYFSIFEHPNSNPQKSIYATSTYFSPRLSHIETSPGDTWTKSSVTTFLSFNPRQYESNHYKQDLMIIKSKTFHYLVQLQVIKS